MVTRHPNVLWAQRRDHVYLTIDLQDVSNPDIKLGVDGDGHGTVAFRAKGEGADPEAHEYGFDLTLYGGIDADDAKIATTARHIVLALPKKEAEGDDKGKAAEDAPKKGGGEEEGGYWPRLLAASGKAPAFVKVDWDKWVDEDDEAAGGGLSDSFDFSSLGGMGGGMMGGGGGGGFDLASLMGGAGGGGGAFDMGSFGGEEEGEEGEEGDGDDDVPAPVDAPAVAATAPAEEITA